MLLETILLSCDKRHRMLQNKQCSDCSYGEFCPHNCEKCLDAIHNPNHACEGAPARKYDCVHMADVYTCKYSCRYTSEIMYALERCIDLHDVASLKVLSFGCGPCTDLFAIESLRGKNVLSFEEIEYRGVDYSETVWKNIHQDIQSYNNGQRKIRFYYRDACELIDIISRGTWVPNLITFQYVFSDMQKHSEVNSIRKFLNIFSEYYNTKIPSKSYIILNDVNLSRSYGGGREFFDELYKGLTHSICRKGRFCDDNAKSPYYPRGYIYGEDSDGEFPCNANRFDITPWMRYSPYNTCASAQMIIKKR